MNREQSAGAENAAQQFCTENYCWLVNTSQRILRRRGFADYGEDLAHEVRDRCSGIQDPAWESVKNKPGYVAKIIVREANRLCHQNGHVETRFPIENLPASTTAEAMEAAILVREILDKLSGNEQELVELKFQGYGVQEIAKKLGISYVAVRKRISRLMMKMEALCEPTQIVRKSHHARGRDIDHRTE